MRFKYKNRHSLYKHNSTSQSLYVQGIYSMNNFPIIPDILDIHKYFWVFLNIETLEYFVRILVYSGILRKKIRMTMILNIP